MTAALVRDAVATAAVFGFFAASWFGWAQDNPQAMAPAAHRRIDPVPADAVAGGLLTWRH